MLDSTLSDSQLRDMLKQVVLTGDDNDTLTTTLLDMEQKFVFATTATIAIPVAQEAALLGKLGGGAAYKTAAKFGLKWLFGGLGGVAVTATSILVYQQQKTPEPQQQKPVITHIQQQPDTSNFFVASKTDSVGTTPTISTPKEVTKQPYELLPLSPVSPIASTPLERQEAVVVGRISKRSLTNLVFWAPEYIDNMQSRANKGSMTALNNLLFLNPEVFAPIDAPEDLSELSELDEMDSYDSEDSITPTRSFDNVKNLEVNVDFGNIMITRAPGNQVLVDQYEGEIATEQRQETLSIFMKPLEKKHNRRNEDIPYFDLFIAVPAGTNLVLATTNGYIDIDNYEGENCVASADFGDVNIKNSQAKNIKTTVSSGSIVMMNSTGNATIFSSFGDVNLEQMNGNHEAHISSGSFSAHGLKGDLSVQSDFGDVSLINTEGNLTVHSNSGSIQLDSINGKSCNITSNFGDLELQDITAECHVASTSGTVNVNNVSGKLTANNQFGDISVENIIGDLVVESQFGNVTMKETKGNVSVQANSGDINGKKVEVTDSLTVSVDFGSSDIQLVNRGENLQFDVEATTGTASVHKGSLKIKKENGHIVTDNGTISIKGSVQIGDISFD